MKFRYIIFTFLLYVPFLLNAQYNNYRFSHITDLDGLSNGLVYDFKIDKTGFLWIATQGGLNKYDGYKFSIYKHVQGDSTSIPDNWINSIQIDSKGNLWVICWNGNISRFIPEKNSFENFSVPHINNKNYNFLRLQKSFIDDNDNLWICTWGNGIYKFDTNIHTFEVFNSFKGLETSSCIITRDKELWLGSHSNGLFRINLSSGEIVNYNSNNSIKRITNNYVTRVLEDDNGNIWIGTYGGGLNLFDMENDIIINYNNYNGFTGKNITSLYKTKENEIWVGTDGNGVYYLDRENDCFHNIRNNPADPYSLAYNRVQSIFEDESGIIWIGTFSKGISKFDKRINSFHHIKNDPLKKNTIINNFIKSIYEADNGDIWFGTYSGITVFDKDLSFKKNILNRTDPNKMLENNRIRSIYRDSEGFIWLATWGGGIFRYSPKRSEFTNLEKLITTKDIAISKYTKDIIEDKTHFYFATEDGLVRMNKKSRKINLYTLDPSDSTKLNSSQIGRLFIDSYDNFWIATRVGLHLFDRKTETFSRFLHNPYDSTSIADSRVVSIFQDSQNSLWIGTYGGGLNKFDYSTKTFSSYTEKDGLPDNIVYEMEEDENNNLWISTNNGLCKFNINTARIKNYFFKDGIQSNEFNGGASLKSSNGRFFFGGVNGVTAFFPKELFRKKSRPRIALTGFFVDGAIKNHLFSNISNATLVLSHDQNNIGFTFSALDFSDPSSNRYVYKLDGFDNEWVNAKNRNYGSYTNVDPGEYDLIIRGTNSDGLWNIKGEKLHIIITPPF